MTQLSNPEEHWAPSKQISVISRTDVEKCIGPTSEHLQLLSGGQAHRNIRVGEDRVLRLYQRAGVDGGKEAALLKRPWKNMIVPEVLGSGDGFVLMKYVSHSPIEDGEAAGSALGRALAEIHANKYPRSGFLGSDLSLEEPMDDFVDDMWNYLCSFEEKPKAVLSEGLLDELLGFFDERIEALKQVTGSPVLLHGDFKTANLHWTPENLPLVLDWEFAYAGSALMDVGQLFRWPTSAEFTQGFMKAYGDSGGQLPNDWAHWAQVLDLINLTGLLSKSILGTPRAQGLAERIRKTLANKERP